MARLRTLWGRVLWGARHWTQEPPEQGVGGSAIALVGIPRELDLVGTARERALVGGDR